jgi:hypothetical protein
MHRCRDGGNAIVEFVWLAVLLLVPLTYVVLAVFRVQATAFGASTAARAAARAYVAAPSGTSSDERLARALSAAALALRDHPTLNATLEDDALVFHDAIDVGLAVDAPEGLIVPVLRGVDSLGLREVAQRAAEAAERKREQAEQSHAAARGALEAAQAALESLDRQSPGA